MVDFFALLSPEGKRRIREAKAMREKYGQMYPRDHARDPVYVVRRIREEAIHLAALLERTRSDLLKSGQHLGDPEEL